MKEYHYLPDGWKLIKINDIFKVFASWKGGYLTGDHWKLNSGIKNIMQDEHFYYVYGWSGSIYALRKDTEDLLTLYNHEMFASIVAQLQANGIICKFPLMEDVIGDINGNY